MKVSALAQMLQVTPETMRKDLDELENQNLIVREHGSAFLKSAISQLPVKIRSQEFPDEKEELRCGRFAKYKMEILSFWMTARRL